MVFLASSIISIIFFLFIVYYLVPVWMKHIRLRRDYRNITYLPISRVPFVGNIHQFDKRSHVFSSLLVRLAKLCQQQQEQGCFCLWYSVWPMIFACTGQNLATFINNSKQLVKSFDYTFLEPWLKTGLLTSNNAKWRTRRRLITPAFHDTQLLHNFMIIFNEQACLFARRLDECIRTGEKGKAFDMFPYISSCTLDIIAETAMGEHVDAQSSEGKNAFVTATGRVCGIINQRIRSPWLWPVWIFDRVPLGREQAKNLKVLHDVSRKIIADRIATFNTEHTNSVNDKKGTRRLVFLDSLLAQMKSEQLSLDDIQEEVDTFMFEGHDTTAAAVNFACYLIGSHPDVQAKVHAEMDAIFSDDRERPCTMDDAQRMIYLDAVIKESMRLLPPVPAVIREIQEDFVCNGQIIRKGTTMYIFIYGVHHDPNVFPQPERFDPNRFYESTEVSEERSPYAFVPFSAGSRNCIGQRFAQLEEKTILSTLLRRYTFRATQTIDELELCFEAVMRPDVPIKLIVEHRQI
ncbi:unnamed protein product [Rotaria socialis]|uniref:Cytochrome P450 n=2 Tax=Rotaria socialis TaxID=392032 RepID=A0A817RJX9_9BILA|nr:unnamed protein product [Rotaria socialis]CAF4528956.1 unnamed protein product [Rotaria socialis]